MLVYHRRKKRRKKTINSQRVRRIGRSLCSCAVHISLCFRSSKIAAEAQHGLISQILKDIVFSSRPSQQAGANRITEMIDTAMAVE